MTILVGMLLKMLEAFGVEGYGCDIEVEIVGYTEDHSSDYGGNKRTIIAQTMVAISGLHFVLFMI